MIYEDQCTIHLLNYITYYEKTQVCLNLCFHPRIYCGNCVENIYQRYWLCKEFLNDSLYVVAIGITSARLHDRTDELPNF